MGMRVRRQKKRRVHRSESNGPTSKGNIQMVNNPTWLPPTRVALTHAWYRRHNQVPPSRRKIEAQGRFHILLQKEQSK